MSPLYVEMIELGYKFVTIPATKYMAVDEEAINEECICDECQDGMYWEGYVMGESYRAFAVCKTCSHHLEI